MVDYETYIVNRALMSTLLCADREGHSVDRQIGHQGGIQWRAACGECVGSKTRAVGCSRVRSALAGYEEISLAAGRSVVDGKFPHRDDAIFVEVWSCWEEFFSRVIVNFSS